jgi:protein-disulfide isomerase
MNETNNLTRSIKKGVSIPKLLYCKGDFLRKEIDIGIQRYIENQRKAQRDAQTKQARIANELGGNEAFWKYADAIYVRTKSNGKGFPINKLVPLAKEIGLDETEFQSCLKSGRYTERVQEDFAEGSRIGITGTPGNILLNNETGEVRVVKGAVSAKVLKANISRMLEKKK